MKNSKYCLRSLPDHVLLRQLHALIRSECANTALVLAHIAEADERRLYAQYACSSMFEYCVKRLGLSEDAAAKRIQVARAARRFTAIFDTVADGRLHLGGARLLAPRLTEENAAELLAASFGQTCAAIAEMLKARFPEPARPTIVVALPAAEPTADAIAIAPAAASLLTDATQPTNVPSASTSTQVVASWGSEHATWHVEGATSASHEAAPAPVVLRVPEHPRVAPLSAEEFVIQMTVGRASRDLLREAQDLLAHAIPTRDLPQVFQRVLEIAVAELRKRKFAATPRPAPRTSCGDARYVPAAVRREVAQRDGERCTFVAPDGRRCEATSRLEYDHVHPAGRGGDASSAANLRLRCRTHNQHAAEQVYGARFMEAKRERAKLRIHRDKPRPSHERPGAMDEATREAGAKHAAHAMAELDRLLAASAPSAPAGRP